MDWNNYFSTVSKSDTGREQITYIPLNLLDSDDQNFYSLSEIPALADNIATVGLQQPLRVRKHPTAEGRFMVVSGHRRRAALEELSKEDPERWAEVACIIQTDEVSPALQQLQLIYANSGTRKLSSADMSEQAVQVEKLLYQLQEEGHEFPGRMREHVAQVMQTTQTKLATLKKIRKDLAACWQPAYKEGKLSESTAYELSKLSTDDQVMLFAHNGEDPQYLYAETVTILARRFDACRLHTCSDGQCCMNLIGKFNASLSTSRWAPDPCQGCCASCDRLSSCSNACPQLAEEVQRIKSEKKEAARQAQAEREERDRPTVALLGKMWQRFGDARIAAGVSIEDSYNSVDVCWNASREQSHRDKEDGAEKLTAYSEVPYGHSCDLGYVKVLCALADLFGCTTDFLLGRTDSRVSSGSPESPESSESLPCSWFPVSVEPPVGKALILIDSGGYVDTGKYKGCGEFTMDFGDPVVLWSYFPDEDDVQGVLPVVWDTGNPDTPGNYAAYIQIDGASKPMLRELYWTGEWWEMHKTRIADEAVVVRWTAQPDF